MAHTFTGVMRETAPVRGYRFAFKSSYLGEVDFSVFGHNSISRVSVRHSIPDYLRKWYNGDPAELEQEIGLLRAVAQPIPVDLCDAFNEWRAQTYEENMVAMEAAPERYGPNPRADCIAPQVVKPGMWTRETGWTIAD